MCKYITRNYHCGCFHKKIYKIACPENDGGSELKCDLVEIIVETEDQYCVPCYLKLKLEGRERDRGSEKMSWSIDRNDGGKLCLSEEGTGNGG
jgi:hypothetical protein